MQIERVVPIARRLLAIEIDETTSDLWLWEHSERVMHLAQHIADLPEVKGDDIDRDALAVAALFHDAGWIVEFEQNRWQRWQLVSRPTNDIQRELGAAMLTEEVGDLLASPTARIAADAIRQCNDRTTSLLEAAVLAEAEALDEMGTLYLLRQFRQYQAEGRPVQQLVESWLRQKEYSFWELRLNDGFRYETTRRLARDRLVAVDAFIQALQHQVGGADLQHELEQQRPAAPSEPES